MYEQLGLVRFVKFFLVINVLLELIFVVVIVTATFCGMSYIFLILFEEVLALVFL